MVLIYQVVQKGQSTRLSAKRAFSNSREPDMPSIVFRIEMSNDAASGKCMEIMNLLRYIVSQLCHRGKIAFSPAVEISFLTEDEQRILLDAIELNDCTPSHAQSIRLKKLSQDCVLTKDQIYEIMSEEKPNQQEHLRFRREDFNGYFPKSYTEQQIKKDILKGLELLHRHRQRNKDAR